MHKLKVRKTILSVTLLALVLISKSGFTQTRVRTELKIPDIPGYITLKCDFHMHTVFSDGDVWPTVRVDEAWREGLDAFSITDHIEYQPHKKDVPTNHNRPYELAQPGAKALDLLIIRGAEITRDMPPGHFNTLFIKDADPLDKKEFKDAVKAAVDQDAFVIWNHPGWAGQQPDGISRWYEDHEELYRNGWLHGIEVVNGPEYYPLVHQWCLEKELTLIGTSDVHNPINMDIQFHRGDHRSMTLVFATNKTETALKEALFAHRTAVYYRNNLIGEEKFLKPIFDESIKMHNPNMTLKGKGRTITQIHNKSDVSFELITAGDVQNISIPERITLYAGKTILFTVRATSDTLTGYREVTIPYTVKNLLIAPEEGLPVELKINMTFIPAEKKEE